MRCIGTAALYVALVSALLACVEDAAAGGEVPPLAKTVENSAGFDAGARPSPPVFQSFEPTRHRVAGEVQFLWQTHVFAARWDGGSQYGRSLYDNAIAQMGLPPGYLHTEARSPPPSFARGWSSGTQFLRDLAASNDTVTSAAGEQAEACILTAVGEYLRRMHGAKHELLPAKLQSLRIGRSVARVEPRGAFTERHRQSTDDITGLLFLTPGRHDDQVQQCAITHA